MLDVAALIVGIDGWEEYTIPLIDSIHRYEPGVRLSVIDNRSATPYPERPEVYRTSRLCYAAAINAAKWRAKRADWYLVLSNDVECTGPFVETLQALGNVVAGPALMQNMGWEYIEGWCVAAPDTVWQAVNGWDNRYMMSSWEDVDFSVSAVEKGYPIVPVPLPFKHLDQRQRFGLPGYGGTEAHNYGYFLAKHAVKVPA